MTDLFFYFDKTTKRKAELVEYTVLFAILSFARYSSMSVQDGSVWSYLSVGHYSSIVP